VCRAGRPLFAGAQETPNRDSVIGKALFDAGSEDRFDGNLYMLSNALKF
jgi:hypothetical protein